MVWFITSPIPDDVRGKFVAPHPEIKQGQLDLDAPHLSKEVYDYVEHNGTKYYRMVRVLHNDHGERELFFPQNFVAVDGTMVSIHKSLSNDPTKPLLMREMNSKPIVTNNNRSERVLSPLFHGTYNRGASKAVRIRVRLNTAKVIALMFCTVPDGTPIERLEASHINDLRDHAMDVRLESKRDNMQRETGKRKRSTEYLEGEPDCPSIPINLDFVFDVAPKKTEGWLITTDGEYIKSPRRKWRRTTFREGFIRRSGQKKVLTSYKILAASTSARCADVEDATNSYEYIRFVLKTPDEDISVDHINGNHDDNRVENLRFAVGRTQQRNKKTCRRVYCWKDGQEKQLFHSIGDAARNYGYKTENFRYYVKTGKSLGGLFAEYA